MVQPAEASLMDALQFNMDDLRADRDGVLSDRQRQYITVDQRKNLILGFVFLVGGILITTTLLYFGSENNNRILQILGMILLVSSVALSWFLGRNWLQTYYDLQTNRVDTIEGSAQHVVRRAGRAAVMSVRIGKQMEVQVKTVDGFKAFEPGRSYRLYRTSHSGSVLAAEKIN